MDANEQYAQQLLGVSEHWASQARPLLQELWRLYQQYISARTGRPAPTLDVAQLEGLAAALKQLESQYRSAAAGQPATDETRRLEQRINDVVARLNNILDQWTVNLRLVAPPTSPPPPGWLDAWLASPGKRDLKGFIARSINQKGLAVSKRLTVKKVEGAYGLTLEFKW